MKNIDDIRRELRDLIVEGIPETMKALKAVLPPNSARYQDLLLIEGRLKEANIAALRGTLSNDDLQLAYNQIRASLLDLINELTDADLSDAPPSVAEPAKARSGNILYRIPDAMQLNHEHKCIVRIAVNEELLLENIELDQDIRLQSIRISDVMLVQLLDPSGEQPFHIRSVNSAEQFIDEDTFTEWLFYVKPLREGTWPLLLKVAVLELVNGKERQREIVLEESIQIISEAVPDPEEAPLKSAAYQLNLSGSTADDAAIYAPQPSPVAPAPAAIPRSGNAPPPPPSSSRRRQIVGIVRVLAMVGVISVVGVVVMQNQQSDSPLVGNDKLPSAINKGEDPSVLPVDSHRIEEDKTVVADTDPNEDPFPDKAAPLPSNPATSTPATTNPSTPAIPSRQVNPVTNMVLVRGGTFLMGCADSANLRCDQNEFPARQVRIRDFSLSATEITAAQYVVFLNAYGSEVVKTGAYKNKALLSDPAWLQRDGDGPWQVRKGWEQYPAVNVTWYGANEFALFYNMRLPSEAEWEYAARGGRTNEGFVYAGSNTLDEVAWYRNNADGRPHAVGMKKANALRLYDMSGNVWEWVADCKHPDYKGAPADGKPWTTGGDCSRRIVRGGSWDYSSSAARVRARRDNKREDGLANTGFRVAKD
jgi:formylglycine-generating enzyme